ncbi:MAG TPA: hypothetical protein VFP70_06075 [Burkholderiales bacterium]|nr:hypothetical protein [Burkholderiales bacterium]
MLRAADDAAKKAPGAPTTEGAAPAARQEAGHSPEHKAEPITGAFGLKLGDRFDPAMVAKVISRKEHAYRDPTKKLEVKGTLYKVEPRAPSDAYNEYLVATTPEGIIYSISGVFADPQNRSKCEETQRLAADLEQKHGKPRGKGSFGNWYAFRDMSSETYRGVRLYAPKCRSGRYSIVYSDDSLMTPPEPPAPEPAQKPGN